MNRKPIVFVYSISSNTPLRKLLVNELQSRDMHVWHMLDDLQDVHYSKDEIIEDAIFSADIIILLFSDDTEFITANKLYDTIIQYRKSALYVRINKDGIIKEEIPAVLLGSPIITYLDATKKDDSATVNTIMDFVYRWLSGPNRLPLEYILEHTEVSKQHIHFSLYSPHKIQKDVKYGLIVYGHSLDFAQTVRQNVLNFSTEFGDLPPKRRKILEAIEIALNTPVTIVPECEGVNFDPESLTKKWDGDWSRFNFDFRVPDTFKEEEIWIRVSIRIAGLEIASIKSSSEIVVVDEQVPLAFEVSDNPLIDAKQRGNLKQAVRSPYSKVFISYSHKDKDIALKRVEEIERILGHRVFIDVKSLRAGDDWKYQLAEAIDKADIFHLLWSEHSAISEYCRYEWRYALSQKCPQNMCVGVIRPVYWKHPMPEPPKELAHLHFEYLEIEQT